MPKLTENEVIDYLSKWLKDKGWTILKTAKDHSHGVDIFAQKGKEILVVEAKGSKGNPKSSVTVRQQFTKGQLETHLGKALVKILKERHKRPNATFAIAHPDDDYIHKCLKDIIPEIIKCNIKFFWVKSSKEVLIEELEENI